jgi:uncharacterized protein YecE (DUF72 family)
MSVADGIFLGTSSFTAAGWQGPFYPRGMKLRDFLRFYAEHFDTVEIDSTFYGIPSANAVKGWTVKTPKEFIFSVKVPQIITHEKVLAHCDAEFEQFLHAMDILGEKLGPIVFQFPFFSRSVFRDRHEFTDRLVPFLKKLPATHKFALELRNEDWLNAEFAGLLREYKVALVLQDLSHMPLPDELAKRFDPITADWTYIRWLGDRKGIEALTQSWDKTVVDRTVQLGSWVDFCYEVRKRGVMVYAYANNHYAGHAPGTIEQFRNLWNSKGLPELQGPRQTRQQPSLFGWPRG